MGDFQFKKVPKSATVAYTKKGVWINTHNHTKRSLAKLAIDANLKTTSLEMTTLNKAKVWETNNIAQGQQKSTWAASMMEA